MSQHIKKFKISWVSELLINILNLKSFASILSYICMCGSWSKFRIQEAPEYGSNTDPDPAYEQAQPNKVPVFVTAHALIIWLHS